MLAMNSTSTISLWPGPPEYAVRRGRVGARGPEPVLGVDAAVGGVVRAGVGVLHRRQVGVDVVPLKGPPTDIDLKEHITMQVHEP